MGRVETIGRPYLCSTARATPMMHLSKLETGLALMFNCSAIAAIFWWQLRCCIYPSRAYGSGDDGVVGCWWEWHRARRWETCTIYWIETTNLSWCECRCVCVRFLACVLCGARAYLRVCKLHATACFYHHIWKSFSRGRCIRFHIQQIEWWELSCCTARHQLQTFFFIVRRILLWMHQSLHGEKRTKKIK